VAMAVRALDARDKVRWSELFGAYIAFYEALVPDAVVETTWQRLMRGNPGDPEGLVVLDTAGGIVGIAHLLFHASTWSATAYCYLEDLFVDPAVRGQGAGRALIEAAYALADARGATRTYWMTREDNTTARALYDRLATRSPFVQYRR
jgi:GNAT superfamily N-acetyltransferase